MIISPLARAYIAAAKAARERAALAAWMEQQRPRMERHLPADQVEATVEAARQHWRELPKES